MTKVFGRKADRSPAFSDRAGSRPARRRDRVRERGSSAVEAAIITPAFLILVFAILEAGPFFLNWFATTATARRGARELAITSPDLAADFDALTVMQDNIRFVTGDLNYVIVFKANAVTDDVPPECVVAARNGDEGLRDQIHGIYCNIYRDADFALAKAQFGATDDQPAKRDRFYRAADRKDYLTGPPDLIGVYVSAHMYSTTGIVGDRDVSDVIVTSVEARKASP